jgi:hypothetical protein
MDIEFRIMGDYTLRPQWIDDIRRDLQGDVTLFEERPFISPLSLQLKALTAPLARPTVTHICLLQDDIKLCKNFYKGLPYVVSYNPREVLSLCKWGHCEHNGNQGFWYRWLGIGGNGIVVPMYIRNHYIKFMAEQALDIKHLYNDDTMFANYLKFHGKRGWTPSPVLIQHLGGMKQGNSVIRPNMAFHRYSLDFIDDVSDITVMQYNWHIGKYNTISLSKELHTETYTPGLKDGDSLLAMVQAKRHLEISDV